MICLFVWLVLVGSMFTNSFNLDSNNVSDSLAFNVVVSN